MTREVTHGRPTTRRYTKEEKDQPVPLVFELCKELGESQGTVVRFADQLRYGTESVRRRVADAEVEAGDAPGMSGAERSKMKKLEQENRELRREIIGCDRMRDYWREPREVPWLLASTPSKQPRPGSVWLPWLSFMSPVWLVVP